MNDRLMTDAHFHSGGYPAFLVLRGEERRLYGVHPWQAGDLAFDIAALRAALEDDQAACVGEIGLDRLRNREISGAQREVFERQLGLAAELRRPVVLHGAKCWGKVVKACRPFAGRIPAFMFHGFSRSLGLLPEMFAMNGFVSVGPAVLNDHAANYREMAAGLPTERLLAETDEDWGGVDGHGARIDAICARLAELRGVDAATLSESLEKNLARFLGE